MDTQKDITKMASFSPAYADVQKIRLRLAVQGDGSNQLCGCANLCGYLKINHLAGCEEREEGCMPATVTFICSFFCPVLRCFIN